jgi:uncharacterized protein
MATFPRMLPQLDASNRFFWTGGEDGQLRLLQCQSCDSFIHPPRPVCPHCLSEEVDSYTINRQKWDPRMEVPFVIARVAVDGAPGVILTTNIVNCPVESVEIGDKVRVVFEQQEDVFLPLFEKVS